MKTVNTGWRGVTPGKCMCCGYADGWGVDGRGSIMCDCQLSGEDGCEGFDFGHDGAVCPDHGCWGDDDSGCPMCRKEEEWATAA